MRTISRSSAETFRKCRRKGYWQYLFKGTGVDTRIPDWAPTIGSAVHKGMEHLFTTMFQGEHVDIDGSVNAALVYLWSRYGPLHETLKEDPTFVARYEESAALVEALLRGWCRVRLLSFMNEFEVISIELETPVLLTPGLILQAKADLVVRSKFDGQLYVINWKTSSSKETDQWDYDVQMWTEALATEGTLGENVAGTIIELLYKGQRKYGCQLSKLIYAYRDKNGELSGEWTRGSTRVKVWELEGGVNAWVQSLPISVVAEQFIQCPPIPKNNDVVQGWIAQTIYREKTTAHVLKGDSEEEKELHFGQDFSNDNCPWCPFKKVCDRVTTIQTLLDEGVLIPRVDHHSQVDNASNQGFKSQEEGPQVPQ